MTSSPSLRIDGADLLIRLPEADALALRPLLRPCTCRRPQSFSTNAILDDFRRAVIGDRGDGVRWPLTSLHGLRVALTPCSCVDAKAAPARGLLIRLSAALARVDAQARRVPA